MLHHVIIFSVCRRFVLVLVAYYLRSVFFHFIKDRVLSQVIFQMEAVVDVLFSSCRHFVVAFELILKISMF